MQSSQEIRRQYIDFFVKKHAHSFVASSPVVPFDDPTLLFTNAGMNQFKPFFLGTAKAPRHRVANTQKCIRAGGKHNDLDDVGRSRRHHTFFEMLGNWSFGDYFKQGAIEMAWELLTKEWKLDPARLHVSCYEGSAGVPRDEEAAKIWRQVANWEQYGLKSDDHIHYFGKDNFWEMGDTGPCGPCTEIYIDRRPQAEIAADRAAGVRAPVNGEDPRVMEIWNNVFIQYNRDAQGVLTTLPAQHVDTGMGLERICQVIQGCDDNYGTDLFTPIFAALSRLSGITYQGKFPKTNAADPVAEAADTQLRYDIAFRVIADHLRCLTFALTDGATPSNEGRGYVLRRILRRAVRFGRQQLNLREPFLHTLVPVVVDTMGAMFPELKKNPQAVVELIKDEEVSFGRTLDRGIQLFEQATADGAISASAAFKLHDTYGFPVDLTRIMAEERGLTVDIAGYEALMEEAKDKARAGGKEGESAVYDLPPDALAKLEALQVQATDDSPKYQFKPITATVRAIWNGRNFEQNAQVAHHQEDLTAVILDKTNFYAEMGGQVGDQGELTSPAGDRFQVLTTRAVGKYVLHVGRMEKGRLSVGESVTCQLAKQRRAVMQNHTATHLANWALREVLGEHVQQKGSLVDADKLRFDFVHTKALETAEVTAVEAHVNRCVAAQMPVYIELAPQEQALKIHGLRAVFGEKYPPQVRVVAVGQPVGTLLAQPDNPQWRQYSVEFCGGTHLGNTSEVEQFVLVSEEAVSKGIRRVVGVTGAVANDVAAHARTVEQLIAQVTQVPEAELTGLLAALQKALAEELPLRVRKAAQAAVAEVQVKIRNAQKAAAKTDTAVDAAALEQLLSQAGNVGGAKLIVAQFNGVSADGLRNAMDWLKKKHGDGNIAILLGSDFVDQDKDGNALPAKANLLAAVGDPLIGKLKAGDWIKAVAALVGGSGGGRPQMAMAGGKDPTQLPQALAAGRSFAEGKLA